MKTFLLIIIPVFYYCLADAQKLQSLPNFGKVDKADLVMKECSFDKSAGAMVLFEEAESFLNLI
jgi:hypothetical protein